MGNEEEQALSPADVDPPVSLPAKQSASSQPNSWGHSWKEALFSKSVPFPLMTPFIKAAWSQWARLARDVDS